MAQGRTRVGIIPVFVDHQRRGAHHRGVLQPQIGPLIAALLPDAADIHILNDTWHDPDWNRRYDLLFLSCLHSDFDRARQISHYWRRRGAKTVIGGNFASTHAQLCAPYFDAVAIGDPETTVPRIWQDFVAGALKPVYAAPPYDPALTPTSRYDLVSETPILPIGLEASRGCPFTCEFCALTAVGTRYHARSVQGVLRDIEAARRTQSVFSPWRRRIAVFYDNNIGGDKRRLRELCEAMETTGLRWGACVSFNVLRSDDTLRMLSKAGCRCLFVGLESFNPATLAHMGKRQNVVPEIREAIERSHRRGILVMAGLMLSPDVDDIPYIESIPERLHDCGLRVPTYICFESPFPGTPQFKRVAARKEPPFLPNALLRDFNGYTLVTRPRHATPDEFVDAYKRLMRRVYAPHARLRKLMIDGAGFLGRGYLVPFLFDGFELMTESASPPPMRNFLGGEDAVPPEYQNRIPFADEDFASDEERDAVLGPWRVADASGRVLPFWLDHGRFPRDARSGSIIARFAREPLTVQPATLAALEQN